MSLVKQPFSGDIWVSKCDICGKEAGRALSKRSRDLDASYPAPLWLWRGHPHYHKEACLACHETKRFVVPEHPLELPEGLRGWWSSDPEEPLEPKSYGTTMGLILRRDDHGDVRRAMLLWQRSYHETPMLDTDVLTSSMASDMFQGERAFVLFEDAPSTPWRTTCVLSASASDARGDRKSLSRAEVAKWYSAAGASRMDKDDEAVEVIVTDWRRDD